jgi:hypothetical protein
VLAEPGAACVEERAASAAAVACVELIVGEFRVSR